MRAPIFGLLAPLVFATVSLSAAPAARADGSFRCGHRLVRDGETEDDVSRKCGKPDAVRTWTEYQSESVWLGGRRVERSVAVTFTEWKYDFGRHRLIHYITFAQGRTVRVGTGGYGE